MMLDLKRFCIFAFKFARLTKRGLFQPLHFYNADNKGIVSRSTRFTTFRGLATYGNYALVGILQNILFHARPKQI